MVRVRYCEWERAGENHSQPLQTHCCLHCCETSNRYSLARLFSSYIAVSKSTPLLSSIGVLCPHLWNRTGLSSTYQRCFPWIRWVGLPVESGRGLLCCSWLEDYPWRCEFLGWEFCCDVGLWGLRMTRRGRGVCLNRVLSFRRRSFGVDHVLCLDISFAL